MARPGQQVLPLPRPLPLLVLLLLLLLLRRSGLGGPNPLRQHPACAAWVQMQVHVQGQTGRLTRAGGAAVLPLSAGLSLPVHPQRRSLPLILRRQLATPLVIPVSTFRLR